VGLTLRFALLSTTNDVREAENKPACELHVSTTETVMCTGKIWTDEYKNTIHVVLQCLNPSFVVALSFLPVESPERISTAIKVPYHARFMARIIATRTTFARVVNYFLLPL